MAKTKKSKITKCVEAKRALSHIIPDLRRAASSMAFGERDKAISRLSNVLENATTINRKIRSQAIAGFVRKGTTFQAKIQAMKKIPPFSATLVKAFDPVFKLAERAVKEAKKESCA